MIMLVKKPLFDALHDPRMDKDGSKSEGSKILFDKLGKSAYIEKIKMIRNYY